MPLVLKGAFTLSNNMSFGNFFTTVSADGSGENIYYDNDRRGKFHVLFQDFGQLLTLARLLYGYHFPSYSLRYIHPEALNQSYI